MRFSDPTLLRQQACIGGQWCAADSAQSIAVHNPATAECLGTVPNMGAAETQRAINAAHAALPDCAVKPPRNAGKFCAVGLN